MTSKETSSEDPLDGSPLSPEKVTTVRFNANDQLVLEQLRDVTGIQSTTEIIRLALRHLAKKPFP